jgi:3-methylcrotonyl-CoA carboxylase alpha subunit
VKQGDEITPYYDPMIAKLIVHGGTRADAIARMRSALAAYEIVGVRTNVEFLGRLMSAPSFVQANLDTALIERERVHLFPAPAEPPAAAWEVAARAVFPASAGDGSPWGETDGWRLGSPPTRAVKLAHAGVERELRVRPGAASTADRAIRSGHHIHVFLDGAHHVFSAADPYLPAAEGQDWHGGLAAPMPGRIVAVLVKAGDSVERGAPLVVMEAMKMEHTVTAPRDGAVARILCIVGEQLKEGTELLVLE